MAMYCCSFRQKTFSKDNINLVSISLTFYKPSNP